MFPTLFQCCTNRNLLKRVYAGKPSNIKIYGRSGLNQDLVFF
ncbi:hypothetical protein NECAME_04897 [Necator americanus]|uniref:Uncharacterized protein n=1 Tax=Necator americanus TaxID=51031 RepID=W2SLC7_NECAM|nr:hypothetical protein NECAME_04897 [Necator americanus]ETN70474.1 hypothetical protein NECAME_04897 [Necator americanus]